MKCLKNRLGSPFEGRTRTPFRARDFKRTAGVAACTAGLENRHIADVRIPPKRGIPQSVPQSNGVVQGLAAKGVYALNCSTQVAA